MIGKTIEPRTGPDKKLALLNFDGATAFGVDLDHQESLTLLDLEFLAGLPVAELTCRIKATDDECAARLPAVHPNLDRNVL